MTKSSASSVPSPSVVILRPKPKWRPKPLLAGIPEYPRLKASAFPKGRRATQASKVVRETATVTAARLSHHEAVSSHLSPRELIKIGDAIGQSITFSDTGGTMSTMRFKGKEL